MLLMSAAGAFFIGDSLRRNHDFIMCVWDFDYDIGIGMLEYPKSKDELELFKKIKPLIKKIKNIFKIDKLK